MRLSRDKMAEYITHHLYHHREPCHCAFHKRGDYWSLAWDMHERTDGETAEFWYAAYVYELHKELDDIRSE